MTTRLLLLCQGATAATRAATFPDDEPLDPHALRRLAGPARRLPRADHILVSPARAAVETAAGLGLLAAVDPALRAADFGEWRGQSLDEVAARDPEGLRTWLADPAAAPHGGESIVALMSRVAAWLDPRGGIDGRTIAITHASVIRAAIVQALGAPASSFWRIDIAPLSTTALTRTGVRWTLSSLGLRLRS